MGADEARGARMEALAKRQLALTAEAAREERDLDMFYTLKQGQLEGAGGGDPPTLLHRGCIELLNATILERGGNKLEILRQVR